MSESASKPGDAERLIFRHGPRTEPLPPRQSRGPTQEPAPSEPAGDEEHLVYPRDGGVPRRAPVEVVLFTLPGYGPAQRSGELRVSALRYPDGGKPRLQLTPRYPGTGDSPSLLFRANEIAPLIVALQHASEWLLVETGHLVPASEQKDGAS